MVRAGLYREKATFQRLTEGAVDAYGNVYSGWSEIGTRAADMRERTGKEKIEAGACLTLQWRRCAADPTASLRPSRLLIVSTCVG